MAAARAAAVKPRVHNGEYFSNLSADSKVRYESKVTYTGLTKDPYAINQSGWTDSPETVPEGHWSDMMLQLPVHILDRKLG